MGIIHVQISFFSRVHDWRIDYYAFDIAELQDEWRRMMDPLMGEPRMDGVTYQISQIRSEEVVAKAV